MSGPIQVPADDLHQTATDMRSRADEIGGVQQRPYGDGDSAAARAAADFYLAIHGTNQGMAGRVNDTADLIDRFGHNATQTDSDNAEMIGKVTGPVGDIAGAVDGAVGSGSGLVGSLGGLGSSLLSTTLNAALRGQQSNQQQNPNNYGGEDYDHPQAVD